TIDTTLLTTIHELLTPSSPADVTTRSDLYHDLTTRVPMEGVVEKMRRDITLVLKGVEQQMSGRSATVAFDLSYRGRDPGTVAQITNTLASFYVEENSKIRERQDTQTAQFLKV